MADETARSLPLTVFSFSMSSSVCLSVCL